MLSEPDDPDFYDEFIHTFSSFGSIIIECRCGRTHVADFEFNLLEPEEREEILNQEQEYPDTFVHWPYTSIAWTYVGEDQVVFDCPCGFDKMICETLVDNYPQILQFIKKIVESKRRDVVNNLEVEEETIHEID